MSAQDFDAYPAFFDVPGAPISQPPTEIIEPSHQLPSGSAVPYYPPDLPHLLNGLVSYWPLDALATNPRSDSVGANTLTDASGTNLVGGAPGIINNAAVFATGTGNAGLTVASNASLQVTGDFTFSAWAYMNNDTGTIQYVLGKDNNVAGNREYGIASFQTSGWLFAVNDPTLYAVATGVPVVYGVWVHLIAWYTLSDQKMRIRVNDTTTYTSSMTATLIQGTAPFRMGQRGDGPLPFIGRIDEVGFWKRLLTPTEMTQLYNGGSGWPFANFTN
jgi:hypothetical protein